MEIGDDLLEFARRAPKLLGGVGGGKGHNAHYRGASGDDASGRVLGHNAPFRRRGESHGSQRVALGVWLAALDVLGADEDARL